jgi:hypothetical protein
MAGSEQFAIAKFDCILESMCKQYLKQRFHFFFFILDVPNKILFKKAP